MARSSSNPGDKSLDSFCASLEDLTFNSKPIIDELTSFAGSHRQLAPQIAQKIEERILEVRPEWKLPSLYLLDSILKNIKGDYMLLFSKNIVHVFCRCFEKLVDADSRKALYKLRLTWPQYFANRKLALIDKHVKALDPNWPVTALKEGPPSPTIFINPKFLESNDKNSQSIAKTNETKKRTSPKKEPTPPKTQAADAPSPKKAVLAVNHDLKKVKEEPMTIQEKRKKLLEEKQLQRKKQEEAMCLSPDHLLKKKKKASPHRHGSPSRRSASPLMVPSPRGRARSASPLIVTEKNNMAANHSQEDKDATPPPEKRPKLDIISSKTASDKSDDSKETAKSRRSRSPMEVSIGSSSGKKVEPKPLRESQLQLDDLPRELLPKHHELILKQIEAQLKSGNLSSEQHGTLCKQLNQLYELQKLKEEEESKVKPQSPKNQLEQTDKRLDDNEHSIPSEEFISLSDTQSDSTFFVDTHGRNDNLDSGPNRGGHHDYRGRPRPHFEPPLEDRFYSRRPPGPYRGDPRPPFRARRGARYPPRRARGPPGRYFDEYNGPPPPMARGRGPPPSWREPPPPQGGDGYRISPGHGPRPPPLVNVSSLFSQLVDLGMIEGGEAGAQRGINQQTLSKVPTLSFTVATLKQRYGSLISLLHVGEQCSTCGVRFPDLSGDEYRKHLDWHYSLNRNEGQVSTSRNWFIHPEDWLKFDELSEESQEKESILKPSVETQEEEEVKVPITEVVCNTCEEALEQFWEEELEEWHFKDATRCSSGKLYHTFCFQDAKEDDLNVSSNSAQPASPEIKH